MEKYINLETLVKNELSESLKDLVICPLCSNILIDPYLCIKCQNVYCKKCIDDWLAKSNNCPNKCEDTNFQKSIDKYNILSKLKFKCKKCENEFLYEEIIRHVDKCIPNNNKINTYTRIKNHKMKKLSKDEILQMRKKSVNPVCITSKKI